jgi:hypothetical protein
LVVILDGNAGNINYVSPPLTLAVHAASGGMNARELQAIELPAPPEAARTTQWSGKNL